MSVHITCESGESVTGNDNLMEGEESLYKFIADFISSLDPPKDIRVITDKGEARYKLIKKGKSKFVKEESNYINVTKTDKYKKKFLTCVDEVNNHYKFYQLEDCGEQVKATYGRIGSGPNDMFGERNYYYPSRMFWIKYLEKISKGYIDKTDIYYCDKAEESEQQPEARKDIKESISSRLYMKLYKYAENLVSDSLVCTRISSRMIDESKKLVQKLYSCKNVADFNNTLRELLSVSPRSCRFVDDMLASAPCDFGAIIQREEDLLSAMRIISGNDRKYNTDFSAFNIKVYDATDKQKESVMKKLTPELRSKVKHIYRVIDKDKSIRFNSYLDKRDIKKVKQYWHGSKSENWLSIIKEGLKLYPNAEITGKMLGDGLYFAPSSNKSWNYTSYRNSYWARGTSDTAFMGLYSVAYGTPYIPKRIDKFSEASLNKLGADCIHAKGGKTIINSIGSVLRNDEIVFYNEDAVLLSYIVEFH